jgi:hypothetical protein
MESEVPVQPTSLELDDIEQKLREKFLESHAGHPHFLVRYIGTSGERGRRCLTFNIEVREHEFVREKQDLEKFVDELRSLGWDIDELRQPLGANDSFDARLWLMIYEEHNFQQVAGEAAQ